MAYGANIEVGSRITFPLRDVSSCYLILLFLFSFKIPFKVKKVQGVQ